VSRRNQAERDLGWLVSALALAAGIATRFWHLGEASLFTDEAYTFAIASLPIPALLQTLATADYHPPLFYLATHVLLAVEHLPLWDYRYASAPFGLVTILATWAVARKLAGSVAAAVSALAVALSPALITFDRIFRMYAVLVALATVSWWLLVLAQSATGARRAWLWGGYAAVSVALAYTHYLGLLVLACQAVYVVVHWTSARPALFAYLLTALAYLPWLGKMREQLALGGLALGRPGFDAGLAASVRGGFIPGLPDALFARPWALWVPLALVCAIAVAGGWIGRRTILPYWLGVLVLGVILSVALGRNLAYFPRYLLVDIPPVAIAFGAIVAQLAAAGARIPALAAATACVALLGVASTNVLVDPYYQFPDWYAVNATLRAGERPSDAVVLDAAYEYLVVRNYSGFRGRTILSFMNPSDFAPILQWIAANPQRRIWYVQAQNAYWDPQLRIAASLANRPVVLRRRFPRQAPENEVTVVLFGPAPARRP